MGILMQVVATLLLCFSTMNMGILTAFPSSTIELYKSENTTLHRPMGEVEISLFSSLQAIGSVACHPLVAIILDRLGRKRTAILSSLMFVISWSIIAMSKKVEAILTAMIISGCGCTIFIEVSIYISEIVQDSIRGTMTAGTNLFYGFGILVSYFLGGILSYHALVHTCLSLSVIGILMIAVLKESPLSLMARGKEKEAVKSLAFYRRSSTTSAEVTGELINIKRLLKTRSEETKSLTQVKDDLRNDKEAVHEVNKISCWQFFKKTSSTRRQFYLIMVLKFTNICQGGILVQVYAEPMFTATVGDFISPNLCSVILGLVMLISGLVAAYLTDLIGRRPLLLYSSVVAGICCVILGVHIQTEWFPKWIFPVFVCVFASAYTLGAGTVTFVILAEVFMPEVKSILSILAVEWSWTCLFLFLFLFNITMQSFGLSPIFFFFGFICFSTCIYFYHSLPETKGLPVYAIQRLFAKQKS